MEEFPCLLGRQVHRMRKESLFVQSPSVGKMSFSSKRFDTMAKDTLVVNAKY